MKSNTVFQLNLQMAFFFEGQAFLGLCFFISKINIIKHSSCCHPEAPLEMALISVDFTKGMVDFMFVMNTSRALLALDVGFWNSLVVLLRV